jgi:hypothetical protein
MAMVGKVELVLQHSLLSVWLRAFLSMRVMDDDHADGSKWLTTVMVVIVLPLCTAGTAGALI